MKFANFLRIKERRSQMRKLFLLLIFLLIVVISNANAFTSESTGTDGELNVTTDTQLQLPPDGVFNFTTVTIQSLKKLTFQKNANNTPVYILATGNVTIAGTIDISGVSVGCVPTPGAGGPGGYGGGYGGPEGEPGGKGLGPGGGEGGSDDGSFLRGGGGGYGTAGGSWQADGGPSYGNVNIVPVIGGSGGGGSFGAQGHNGYAGPGGGGAIVIASSGTINISGSIDAEGGETTCADWGGNGSGGAIKLMANYISGSGTLLAKGGYPTRGNYGGSGRIRLEAEYSNTFNGTSDPAYTFIDTPGSVLPANLPGLAITSIVASTGNYPAPASPTGSYSQPDILLPSGSSSLVTVNVAAQHIPTTAIVTVTVIPQYGDFNEYGTILTGTEESSTGSTQVTLSTQYPTIIVAQTTFIMQMAMYYDGEKIEKVRVAAKMGKESETVFITKSGKEIKSEMLKLAGLVR